jgi:hypothetical protein
MSIQRDVDEARSLLAQADAERDPEKKLGTLEEAIDLLDLVAEEAPEGSREKTLAANLRRSYARRLLAQLVELRSADLLMWFGYAQFLLERLGDEVEALLEEEPGMRTAYETFFALWPVDVRALLNEPGKRRS